MSDLVPAGEVVVDAELVDEHAAGMDALIEQWITARAKSVHTETAYRGDLQEWLSWCGGHGVDPMQARKTDVERWHQDLAATPTKKTRRPPLRATLARKVSSIASFYSFLVDEDYLEVVPVRGSTRPRAEKHSSTIGLSAQETVLLQDQAAGSGAREQAEIGVLLVLGLRVSEMSGLRVKAYNWHQGVRVLKVVGKGTKTRELVVDGDLREAVDRWLKELAVKLDLKDVDELDPETLVFPNIAGGEMTAQAVTRVVQRLAKAAGIKSWPKITPHSLRHTCATNMLDAGIPINVVQEQLGHEDISTTLRYDRARTSMTRKIKGTGDYQAYLQTVRTNLKGAA